MRSCHMQDNVDGLRGYYTKLNKSPEKGKYHMISHISKILKNK